MAQVFTLEPNPHWVIIDNFSKLPNGAAIYTYRSLNPTEFKPAFEDAGGTIPYGQPIVGFGNGTMPPIFWAFDDAFPEETYYIEVWSAPQDQQGVLLWTFDGLSGGGGGGGGTIVTNNDVENFIVNGEFYRNIGDQVGTPSLPLFLSLAPSAHEGIGGYENSPNDGPPSPDIIFAKSNQSDSDSISFTEVNPIGTNNLGTINPTPQIFVDYNCTVGGTAQTYKYIQIPILKGLQNLSNITASFQIYARLVSGSTTDVTLNLRQFFGNGGAPSADVKIPIGGGPIDLDPMLWKQIQVTSQVIPSIVGKTLGACGNDALYFQIAFPLSNPIRVQFILPGMWLGKVTSNIDFHTLDQVNAIVDCYRTGDTRTSLNDYIFGWVIMNDGTIGSASSGATTRANIDTFQLFDLIWNLFQANQTLAPMFTSAGVPVAYGADSVTDFVANRRLSLTRNAGRVMAGVGTGSGLTARSIGQIAGGEVNTIATMPSHSHSATFNNAIAFVGSNVGGGGTPTYRQDSGTNLGINVSNTGGGATDGNLQPTVFMNVFIKL